MLMNNNDLQTSYHIYQFKISIIKSLPETIMDRIGQTFKSHTSLLATSELLMKNLVYLRYILVSTLLSGTHGNFTQFILNKIDVELGKFILPQTRITTVLPWREKNCRKSYCFD